MTTPTTYGRKGGTGPTKGKKLVKFQATDPQGNVRVCGTYNPPADGDAYMMMFERGGFWRVAGLTDGTDARSGRWHGPSYGGVVTGAHTAVPATRVPTNKS